MQERNVSMEEIDWYLEYLKQGDNEKNLTLKFIIDKNEDFVYSNLREKNSELGLNNNFNE